MLLLQVVDSEGIVVGGQRIQAGTVLWGAGVVASPAGRWLEVETDRSGRIIVGPDLIRSPSCACSSPLDRTGF